MKSTGRITIKDAFLILVLPVTSGLLGLALSACMSAEPQKAQAEAPKRHVDIIFTDASDKTREFNVFYTHDPAANLCTQVTMWREAAVIEIDCKRIGIEPPR